MAEGSAGARAILSRPFFYDTFARLVGGKAVRRELAARYIRAHRGSRVLDIGCGTAAIVEYLPNVEYFGFDAHPAYIAAARRRHPRHHKLWCQDIASAEALDVPPCDIVLAIGVVHHLDDGEACKLFTLASKVLAPGGRLVTADGCYMHRQRRLDRMLLSSDRGKNVRRAAEYRALAAAAFDGVSLNIRHDLLRIPYTHVIMECSNVARPNRDSEGDPGRARRGSVLQPSRKQEGLSDPRRDPFLTGAALGVCDPREALGRRRGSDAVEGGVR